MRADGVTNLTGKNATLTTGTHQQNGFSAGDGHQASAAVLQGVVTAGTDVAHESTADTTAVDSVTSSNAAVVEEEDGDDDDVILAEQKAFESMLARPVDAQVRCRLPLCWNTDACTTPGVVCVFIDCAALSPCVSIHLHCM